MKKRARQISYLDFTRQIERQKIEPVYFFIGEENYLKEQALRKFKKILFPPEVEVFNYDFLWGDEIEGSNLLDLLQTSPFMAAKRLLVIREIERLSLFAQELLISYLEKPLVSTCLVLWADKLDPRKRFFIVLTEKVTQVNFNPLNRPRLISWIEDYFRQQGKEIDPEAAHNLWELVGNNLAILSQEIEKIITYAGEKKFLHWEDVEAVVTGVKLVNIFDLVEAVGKKEKEKALFLLSRLFQTGEDPLTIVRMLARQWRLIWEAKQTSTARGKTAPGWSRVWNSQFREQSQHFTIPELMRGFRLLLNYDLDLKSSGTQPRWILEQLIINLCQS